MGRMLSFVLAILFFVAARLASPLELIERGWGDHTLVEYATEPLTQPVIAAPTNTILAERNSFRRRHTYARAGSPKPLTATQDDSFPTYTYISVSLATPLESTKVESSKDESKTSSTGSNPHPTSAGNDKDSDKDHHQNDDNDKDKDKDKDKDDDKNLDPAKGKDGDKTSSKPSLTKTTSAVSDQFHTATDKEKPPTTFVPHLDPSSLAYKDLTLEHHNIHRRNHSAEDLKWSDELAQYAEIAAKACVWAHNLAPGGGQYGQNIAAGYRPSNISGVITNGFYNGEMSSYPEYDTDTPNTSSFKEWGHFSQLVWKATKSVACYTEICSPSGSDPLDCKPDGTSYLKGLPCGNKGIPAIFTVCNYHPAGNVYPEYTNVGAPQGKKPVFVDGNGVHGL